MESNETCSKCSGELDTKGAPKWCKACRAAYQKDNRDGAEDRAEARGFAKGVDAARITLQVEFARIGQAMLSGTEVAWAIGESPRPTR